MNKFELDPVRDQGKTPGAATASAVMGTDILVQSARWFVNIRWVMAALCVAWWGVCTLAPGVFRLIRPASPVIWPWTLALVLAAVNAIFHVMVRRLSQDCARSTVETNLWLQVVADLLVVTVVVHVVGSTNTLIAFAYLFHIALSGVFFPRRDSLLVALLAACLYLACVTFEITGILPPSGVLQVPLCECRHDFAMRLIFAGSAVLIWMVVWYLVSTLSEAVRRRDQRLDTANQRIVKADQEQNRQVLSTAHDLKAPCSGIESSIGVLRSEHWEVLPGSVRRIVERIERRAERLRKQIEDMLLLGDIRSQVEHEESQEGVVLRSVLNDVVSQLGRKAEERDVTVQIRGAPAVVFTSSKEFAILLVNLVSNAISYSREGGLVTVSVAQDGDEVRVSVSDNGIGIRADALPHVFDDYFRTKEAAEFNRMSTGLGLAIVKEIALRLGLKIAVTSEEGTGTTFEVTIPGRAAAGVKQRRPADHGYDHDNR